MHDWYQQNTDAPNWRKMSWKENETVYINSKSKTQEGNFQYMITSSANVLRSFTRNRKKDYFLQLPGYNYTHMQMLKTWLELKPSDTRYTFLLLVVVLCCTYKLYWGLLHSNTCGSGNRKYLYATAVTNTQWRLFTANDG